MKHENVHSFFSRIASEFPGNIAIAVGPRQLSYRELEERSNSLANFLLDQGAAAGAPVAVLTNDRVRVLTAVLGILKARCVFAPLDPQLPEKRREAMMSLLAPEWFLTETQLLRRVADKWEELADFESYFNPAQPEVESQPDDMCYVYFTSGSTGQPKGIAGRLKGIDHFIRWEIKTLGLDANTRVSQILPPTFDGSLRDMFVPLCTGGTACAPEDSQTLLETDKLIAWLDRERINVVHCVPSLFRSLLNAKLTADNFKSLQHILLAGEPLLPADVRRWTNVFGERIQLINLYGTSETTMAKFAHFVKASDHERRTIPVGQPIEGATAMVVDKRGRPCPRGVIGEIYIRTPYRSLGYYNQPELTRESFIPNPFSDDPDDIVYKTGDLGRLLEDGNFEYLGRLDRQVKIRGNRVELAEVEDVLRGHPAVSDIVVIDREDSTGVNYLCAYVVAAGEIDTAELQQLVADRLPDYMTPSAFIIMESLPRTISGKIDRQALPAPGLTRAGMGEFVAPATDVEKLLARIWTEVLGIEQIGIHDNFFRLGGHSLRATQILSRVRAALNVEVPLRSLFQTPTVAGLAALINPKLPSPVEEAEQIKPVSRPDPLPLSFGQQRLWFIDQLEPGSSTYNLPLLMRLTGPLNVQALGRTLTEIVRRHEALRTTFSVVDNNPIQVISAPSDVSLTLIDLSSLAEPERETAAQTVIGREARHPFDLARGPLLRPVLVRLAAQEHIALLTMHHIISDGWSEGVLVRELATLYDAFAQGKQSPLAELRVQYADYAVWQREWLQGEVLEEQMSYWRERLAGSSGALELPVDYARPAVQSYRGASLGVRLSKELTRKLQELSEREGVTLFMTLLTGWQTLLARYSGQWDLNIGTPIANRTHNEVEGLIGFFVNTLVLRTQLKPEASFREQLQQVREVCLGAYAHQDVPFEMLVEELQPERHLSRSPLFQVVFALQNAPEDELHLRGLKLAPMEVATETAKFDLTLITVETETGLAGSLSYSTDLFAKATIERMLEHWRVLLEAAVADAEQSLAELPLLSEAEYEQVREWNDTAVAYPRERTIAALFAEQAAHTPAAAAVEYDGTTLSYEELNRRANQLAHYLRRLGVGPEVRIGLSMDRSLELIVALLGIVKAGGAYVPLDREYPPERLRFMIEDAQLRLVLTNDQTLIALADETGVQLLELSAAAEEISRESEAEIATDVTADNLAYVIYTSGSTGTPKGVEVTQRAVLRLVINTDYLQLTPADRVAQVANTSFDASTFEVWGSLLNGSTLVPFDQQLMLDAEAFAVALKARHISALFLTAALFNQLVQTDQSVFAAARAVLVGGEAVDPRWMRAALQGGAPERLVDAYGPTEVTTFAVTHTVTEVAAGATMVPIGKPIANTEAYVLDESLRFVPVGVHGELYLGGDGLARGYLDRPELTAERFVPHAFARHAGERLYRTGDVVRYLSDGVIEFIGRRDTQVKVRGFRIELGEIEAVLAQHPHVREAVAIVREPQPGNKQLVAYVVGEVTLGELRPYLKEKLPDYMTPQLVKLEQLPLTANGKIDRQALPAPDKVEETADGFVAPRTAEEELLAGIWAEVLAVERVSVHDNFFERGGHSLLATQVVSRLRSLFQIDLPLRALFDAPTLADLAQLIVSEQKGSVIDAAPPIERRNHDKPPALSYAQQRLWFLDQFEPDSPFYNVPAGIYLKGELNHTALAAALNEIARRHEVLRTTFPRVAGPPVQLIAPPAPVDLPLIDLQTLPEEDRREAARSLAADEASQPFDLAHGPVWRLKLVRLGEQEHVLLLTMHHIITDGWSGGVLMRELSTLYDAYRCSEASPLAELTVQYADYAEWQREWLQGAVLEEQLGYWREQLAGSSGVLEFPADHARPAMQSYRGASRTIQFSEELTRALRELSRREGVTLFMTLLTGWQTLLARYSGEWDLNVGTPIANRTRHEVEGLIGFFVNTLVLRSRMNPHASFREQLQQVREVCLGAYAHQDIPFEMLVEELQPERHLSRSPLFQVMFALQNAPQGELQLRGLTLEPFAGEENTTKFDLTLITVETETGLAASLSYSTDLFAEETIARMLEHWRVLLEAAVAEPGESLAALPFLTEAERQRLVQWNETAAEYQRESTIDVSFAEQAAKTPGAIAVEYQGAQLSYAELNRRANQLAHYLQSLGIGPEVRVGLCMERSLEMLVGMLAILKAGGAYVPLDRQYPRERLRFMIEDAQIWFLLANGPELAGFADESGVQLIDLTAEAEAVARESEAEPASGVTADNLAYVIYTSGSTGIPKGVAITRANAAAFLHWATRFFSAERLQSVLASTSINFDISVFELFAPLSVGGRVILAGNALQLPELEAAAQIELINTVPSAMAELIRQNAVPPSVRVVNLAGEALSRKLVQEIYAFGTVDQVLNLYGPSEDTTYSTWETVADEAGEPVLIGRPISNSQIYLLDKEMQQVALGVPGELYIAGDGLARGYLDRAELTAERFVPSPFACAAGARLYRTGDLARYKDDGRIEYLGRLDHQVKVRGFRIELGEIEAQLERHPLVHECVVTANEAEAGGKRLVAYVAAAETVTTSELRRYLKEQLPDYMVPQWIVKLDQLPLNANGKVDRKALPAPERTGEETVIGYVAPRTPEEELLAGIWAEVLEVERVSVHDNFFDSGGHSLLATLVMSRIRTVFNLELPVRNLFEHPTVAELAEQIRTMVTGASERDSAPATVRVSREAPRLVQLRSGGKLPFICVHPGGGSIVTYLNLAQHLDSDQPLYALQASGIDEAEPVHETVEAMAADHLSAIREAGIEGPYFLGGWSMGGVVAYEMARQLSAAGEEVAGLLLIDAAVPHAEQDPDETTVLVGFAQSMGLRVAGIDVSPDKLREMDTDEKLALILDTAKQQYLLRGEVELTDLERHFKVYRANLRALSRYRPQAQSVRIALFRADEHVRLNGHDKALGWNALTDEKVEVFVIPGNHYTLFDGPHVRVLAEHMQASLDKTEGVRV